LGGRYFGVTFPRFSSAAAICGSIRIAARFGRQYVYLWQGAELGAELGTPHQNELAIDFNGAYLQDDPGRNETINLRPLDPVAKALWAFP